MAAYFNKLNLTRWLQRSNLCNIAEVRPLQKLLLRNLREFLLLGRKRGIGKAGLGIAGAVLVLVLGGVGYIGAKNGWFGGGASVPEDTFSRGLVGYWSFDEGGGNTAYDASGNGNNGTLTNGPEWTKGKDGGAMFFDSKNDYVNCTSNNLAITGDLTISAWIKLNVNTGYHWIVSKEYQREYTFGVNGSELRFYHGDGTYYATNSSGAGLLANKWHYVSVTRNTNQQKVKFYVDGKYISEWNYTNSVVSGSADVRIGTRNDSYSWFNGLIDDVRIYNRALSEAEVKYHYNHGGPVGYWAFDEGSGTSAKDSSGNNNDGTISGATWTDGKYGSALSFDGDGDYVNMGNSSAINLVSDYTISLWLKTTSADALKTIYMKNYASYGYRVTSLNYPSTGKVSFTSGSGADVNALVSNSSDLNNGAWRHLVLQVQGTTQRIYIDGVLDNTRTRVDGFASDTNFTIGYHTTSTRYFNGLIDDFKVYNYARSADEIRLDYQAGMATHLGSSGKTCSEDPASCMDKGLVGHWDMDEGSGSTINDKSENGNKCNFVNAPKWTKGKNNGALQFGGKNDYINCGNVGGLLNTGAMSMEAWVFLKQDKWQYVLGNGYQYENGFTLGFHSGAQKWRVTNYIGGYNALVFGSALFDQWVHVLVTFDNSLPSANWKTYVNGIAQETANFNNFNGNSGRSLRIGGDNGDTRYLNGLIDGVRIYNRALSMEEIRYHYNHGGPVGYWKFDEGSGTSAKDSSGNNNDGVISGATWADGKYGSALSFDGNDDYVECANLSISGVNTKEAWIKTSALSGNHYILDMGSNNNWIQLYDVDGDSKLEIRAGSNGTNYVNGNYEFTDSSQWYHIVVTTDSNGVITIYVNGKYDNSAAKVTNTPALLRIGRYSGGLSYNFAGSIDDVRIYNYARTADEIRLDYQAGMAAHLGPSGKTCSEDPASCMDKGLVGYWDMDEGKGSIIDDKSGNGNNGTLTNGPKWAKGKEGGALQFDGKNDYVNCGNNTVLNEFSALTVEAWINPKSYSNYGRIVDKQIWGAGSFVLMNNGTSGALSFGVSNEFDSRKSIGTNSVMPLNKFSHVIGTWDGSLLRIYFNGKEESVPVAQTGIISANRFVSLGAATGGALAFDGIIDGVRIYNRALSAEEVRYHYNQGEPVAHWDMDEGEGSIINDKSGNHNKGTISGAAWVAGKYGSALSFDGSNDYVDCGNKSSLNITKALTIGAWIKRADLTTDTYKGTIAKDSTGGYVLSLNYAAGDHKISYISPNVGSRKMTTAIQDTDWHYVAVTVDENSGVLKFYLDGKLDSSHATIGTLTANNYSLILGRRTNYFGGLIDDVRIYNYARTAEQIRVDYNNGAAAHLK